MADTAKFSALYYPYSRCLREVDLKRMVFIFDEILFVDPLSKDLGLCPGQYPVDNKDMRVRIFQDSDEVYFGDRYLPIKQRGIKENFDLWNWFDIRETYSYLQAEGVVKLIDPVKTIRKNDTLIGYSVVTDMIRGIASTSGTRPYLLGGDVNLLPKWILHHQRIPDIFTEIQKDNLLWQSLLNRQRSREENSIEQDYNVEVYRNLINETIIAKETSNSDSPENQEQNLSADISKSTFKEPDREQLSAGTNADREILHPEDPSRQDLADPKQESTHKEQKQQEQTQTSLAQLLETEVSNLELKTPTPPNFNIKEGDCFYVNHAGVVIVHPFLSTLLTALNYWTKDGFTDD
ncbi:MAG: contractile injection system tape measure protein, partial [Cyanobacteria bacterium P01_F01_bin.86]